MVEGGKGHSSQEAEPQKGAKQARVTQTVAGKRSDSQVWSLAWTLAIVLDKDPLFANASIRDFQQGKLGYVANAVE